MKSLLFSVVLAVAAVTGANAQYVNYVFNPSTTITTVGQTINVNVVAQFTSASPMDAAVINFSYDPTILQATAVTNNSTELTSFVGPTFDNGTGTVNFVGVDLAAPYLTANHNIINITFNVLAVPAGGTTTLSFNRPPTEAAVGGSSVLNTVTNGTVSISNPGCTPPSASISAAPTCDANAFNLVLTAATGTAPYDLTITSPTGTATYNDIPVSGVITNFTPPTERIWPAAPAPATSEDQAITVGVRFQSSVTGFIKGVRFYAPDEVPVTPGNFTGQLWTAGGVSLATGTFTGVVADAWNELIFSEPILISANTIYVASYHTNAIKYAGTPNGLAAPVVTGHLTATATGGVFTYGAAVAFPATATNNNYWADVIFSPNNYAFNLTGVKDATECTTTGALQTLNVTSVDCSTLPVSLINFSATPKDDAVLLRWSTASEFNNLGFEVQRSIDGTGGWSAIAFVNGAGNSTSTLNYSYVDEKLTASRYYYRLKQVDIDQHFAYSPIVSVDFSNSARPGFGLQQNYPNPFKGETIIRFTLPQKSKVNLAIFDMNGKMVRVLVDGSKDAGSHAVTLNSGVLTSGMYYYKLQAGDFSAVKKMTIH